MSESPSPTRTAAEIREWIIERLIHDVGLSPDEVDGDKPVVSFGVDSMQFVVLVGELESWLGVRFADNPLIDHPTVNALSTHLARQLEQGRAVIDPTADL